MLNLKALSLRELQDFVTANGLPAYRFRQLVHWLYEKKAQSLDEITVLSKGLRQSLSKQAYIANFTPCKTLTANDGTVKYLFRLEDGEFIESVVISDAQRTTLCVSSQVGCQMGCRFCLTAQGGFRRNLTSFEIIEQVIFACRHHCITNIVFMGMGEPLMNLEAVTQALKTITTAMKISPKKITLSTSGVVDKLIEFSRLLPEVKLAISLNAVTDDIRSEIMPINRRFDIEALLNACRAIKLPRGRRITFEYVLLSGINDSKQDAMRLTKLLKGIPSKINLIPFNAFEGSPFKSPNIDDVLQFQDVLQSAGYTAIIRKSKGSEILAGCGQLRASQIHTRS